MAPRKKSELDKVWFKLFGNMTEFRLTDLHPQEFEELKEFLRHIDLPLETHLNLGTREITIFKPDGHLEKDPEIRDMNTILFFIAMLKSIILRGRKYGNGRVGTFSIKPKKRTK